MSDGTIYHYCSLDTLINIFKNKTFRLSDVNRLNDKKETKALMSIIKQRIIEKILKVVSGGYLIYGMSNENAVKYIVDIAINQLQLKSNSMLYVGCFSGEDDLLSQWISYGDNGKGVAIGFNIDYFNFISNSYDQFQFNKVRYIDIDIDDLVLENNSTLIFDQIYSAMEKGSLYDILTNPNGSNIFDKWDRDSIFKNFIFDKHVSFKSEDEYRLVFNSQTTKESYFEEFTKNDFKELFPNSIQFKSIGNNIISYVDLLINEFSGDGNILLNKVVLGPNCNANKDDIILLLQSCDFFEVAESIGVVRSKSTYRNF